MKVAALALDVDGGCPNCAGGLLSDLREQFPEQAEVWGEAAEANDDRYEPGESVAAFQARAHLRQRSMSP